jgi:hypothetical protein
MKKIPSLFVRDFTSEGGRLVLDQVTPGTEWVTTGEGIATVKHDGTACLWSGGQLYARYDAKHGKTPPAGFIPAQEPDPVTGHYPGWILVTGSPAHQWHREALAEARRDLLVDGATYELVGPKVQGNPYRLMGHYLWQHAASVLAHCPRTFLLLRDFLRGQEGEEIIEGVVWHHPDGRMVKIKRRDFGFPWPPPVPSLY